jgi:methylmalonic aciduria homocystinuria type C protein
MQPRWHRAIVPCSGVEARVPDPPSSSLASSLAALASAGFDIAHTFDVAAVVAQPGLAVLAGAQRMGVLVGNTRALWQPFTAALRDPVLAAERDPLERYTERTIDAAFGSAGSPGSAVGSTAAPTRIYYGHRRYDGAFLPMQRLAALTGLGALAPNHLVIHPIYGPWFALRAILLVDGEPPARAPIAQPCSCSASCATAFTRANESADWRDWLAVRDSCSLRDWRYSEDQVSYHYASGLAGRGRQTPT